MPSLMFVRPVVLEELKHTYARTNTYCKLSVYIYIVKTYVAYILLKHTNVRTHIRTGGTLLYMLNYSK